MGSQGDSGLASTWRRCWEGWGAGLSFGRPQAFSEITFFLPLCLVGLGMMRRQQHWLQACLTVRASNPSCGLPWAATSAHLRCNPFQVALNQVIWSLLRTPIWPVSAQLSFWDLLAHSQVLGVWEMLEKSPCFLALVRQFLLQKDWRQKKVRGSTSAHASRVKSNEAPGASPVALSKWLCLSRIAFFSHHHVTPLGL